MLKIYIMTMCLLMVAACREAEVIDEPITLTEMMEGNWLVQGVLLSGVPREAYRNETIRFDSNDKHSGIYRVSNTPNVSDEFRDPLKKEGVWEIVKSEEVSGLLLFDQETEGFMKLDTVHNTLDLTIVPVLEDGRQMFVGDWIFVLKRDD
jgi:hypothetical protein